MYQRPVPNPYRDIEPTGNIFTDARKQFVQLFGGSPSSHTAFHPITREFGEDRYHKHKDRFGQLFEEMQADLAEGMDLQQIREKYSQTPEARAYLNFQANYDPAKFAKDNPDLAKRGTMNAKQAWKAALFTDKIDYNEPGGGFYQEQAEEFLSENADGRTPATIRDYREREMGLWGPDLRIQRQADRDKRKQARDMARQQRDMARQEERARRRAEGGIGSLRDRAMQIRPDIRQQMKDRRLIRNEYQDLFGRRPDRAGRDYWMRSLQQGNVTPENLREALIAGADPKDLEYYQSQYVQPGFDDPDPNLIRPDSVADFGDKGSAGPRPNLGDIDYSAADIGGGRPPVYADPRPSGPDPKDRNLISGEPFFYGPDPFVPAPTLVTPETIDDTGFFGGASAPYGMPGYGGGTIASTDPVTGETTVGAGTFNPNTLPRPLPKDVMTPSDDTGFFGSLPPRTPPGFRPSQGMPQGGGTYESDVIMPGINKPPQFNLPPRTPPGFRPSQGMVQSLLGSGIDGMDLYEAQRKQMGTGPVDPMRAMTDPYYRFTPAAPAVEGNVLTERPGPVNQMPTPQAAGGFNMPVSDRPFPTDFRPYMAVDDFGAGVSLPHEDISQTRGGTAKGGMSPGQTYQPYTPAGSGFGGFGGYGGYGGGMGGGKGGTQPRPASGGKGGAQYMGTPPSYSPYV